MKAADHIFVASKCEWHDITDDLPVFRGGAGRGLSRPAWGPVPESRGAGGLDTAFRSPHTWTTLQAIPCDETVSMHTTNVRELKKNPSRALRLAKDGPVLILKGNEPDALLIHLDKSLTETESGVRPALAASLYGSGGVSLGKAARISGLSLSEFVDHLGNLGVEIVRRDETTDNEVSDVSAWLAS